MTPERVTSTMTAVTKERCTRRIGLRYHGIDCPQFHNLRIVNQLSITLRPLCWHLYVEQKCEHQNVSMPLYDFGSYNLINREVKRKSSEGFISARFLIRVEVELVQRN